MSSEDFMIEPIQFDMDALNATAQSNDKFQQLYSLNVNEKTEKKNGLTYLSWAAAWAEFKKVYPNASYRIIKNPTTNLPYFFDPEVGLMVFTEVIADHQSYEMWMPVMDSANKAMKLQPYSYQVWDSYKKQYVEKTVAAATMFDVNKAIMRCLTKNLAMFGLGLYIYAGEDLPEALPTNEEQPVQAVLPKPRRQRKAITQPTPVPDRYAGIRAALQSAIDMDQLMDLYRQHKNEVDNSQEIKDMFSARKLELLQNAA